jgi:hypothetical protein
MKTEYVFPPNPARIANCLYNLSTDYESLYWLLQQGKILIGFGYLEFDYLPTK